MNFEKWDGLFGAAAAIREQAAKFVKRSWLVYIRMPANPQHTKPIRYSITVELSTSGQQIYVQFHGGDRSRNLHSKPPELIEAFGRVKLAIKRWKRGEGEFPGPDFIETIDERAGGDQ